MYVLGMYIDKKGWRRNYQRGNPVAFSPPIPGTGAGQEQTGAGELPRARVRMVVIVVEAPPSRAERRPKRRNTSEVVTRMEMMMRTIMIQVWSMAMLV